MVVISVCGCVENEAGDNQQGVVEQEQETELSQEDTDFIVWVVENSQSMIYYQNEILDSLEEDLSDMDFQLLLASIDAKMKFLENSEKEIKDFTLSAECEKIRSTWLKVIDNQWYVDYYTLYKLKVFSEEPVDEELYNYYSDIVDGYTQNASGYIKETWRLMEIAVS